MGTDLDFVIFGFGGDLSRRKLIPALYELYVSGIVNENAQITALGRKDYSSDDFAELIEEAIREGKGNPPLEFIKPFSALFTYHKMDISSKDDYQGLRELLDRSKASKVIYYYAISPSLYTEVSENLFSAGLSEEKEGQKVIAIIEKPFGHDWASSIALNNDLHKFFKESQLYRIDHYLGKETVQNILVTRFSNSIFEPLWNRNYIDYVEISAYESLSVGNRIGYYDNAGALRDMVQNHLLQVLAIIAMEPPVSASADCLRNEMVKVFQSLRPFSDGDVKRDVVRAQYASTSLGPGYLEEKGVRPLSKTETYVAIKCYIDSWRWSGVPFYIKTGKALKSSSSEVVIHFKDNPHKIFSENENLSSEPNQLIIRIQPDEGMVLRIGMKIPGPGFNIRQTELDFHYSDSKDLRISDSYVRLISDAIHGDPTLYQRSDAIELTWKYVDPILKAWEEDDSIPLYSYKRGSWGPENAELLLSGKENSWRIPCSRMDSQGFCSL